MEKLRQAIRDLEKDAERFERQVGAERVQPLDEQELQKLIDKVDSVRSYFRLAYEIASDERGQSPEKPVAPEKPAEVAKGEESPV